MNLDPAATFPMESSRAGIWLITSCRERWLDRLECLSVLEVGSKRGMLIESAALSQMLGFQCSCLLKNIWN